LVVFDYIVIVVSKMVFTFFEGFENICDSYPLSPTSSSAMGSPKCSSPQPQRTDVLRVSLGDTIDEVISEVVAVVEEEEGVVVFSNVVSDTICDVVGDTCV
jgi:hypothetical protein